MQIKLNEFEKKHNRKFNSETVKSTIENRHLEARNLNVGRNILMYHKVNSRQESRIQTSQMDEVSLKPLNEVFVSARLKKELFGSSIYIPYHNSKEVTKKSMIGEMSKLYMNYKKSKESIKQVYKEIQLETAKLNNDI